MDLGLCFTVLSPSSSPFLSTASAKKLSWKEHTQVIFKISFQLSAEVRELGRSAPAHRGMLQDLEAWVLSEAAIQAHHEEALPACGFTTCSPSTALLWRLETVAPSLSEVGRSCPSFVHVSLCEALSAATSPRTGPEPQRLRCRVRSRVSLS